LTKQPHNKKQKIHTKQKSRRVMNSKKTKMREKTIGRNVYDGVQPTPKIIEGSPETTFGGAQPRSKI
jgi:hypothetical protein